MSGEDQEDELTDRLAGVLLVVLPLPVEDGRPVGEAGAPTGARHSETEERISWVTESRGEIKF